MFWEEDDRKHWKINGFVPPYRLPVDDESVVLDPTLELAVAGSPDPLPFPGLEVADLVEAAKELPGGHTATTAWSSR